MDGLWSNTGHAAKIGWLAKWCHSFVDRSQVLAQGDDGVRILYTDFGKGCQFPPGCGIGIDAKFQAAMRAKAREIDLGLHSPFSRARLASLGGAGEPGGLSCQPIRYCLIVRRCPGGTRVNYNYCGHGDHQERPCNGPTRLIK